MIDRADALADKSAQLMKEMQEIDVVRERLALMKEMQEIDVVRERLALMPDSFGELLDWLAHYCRYGNVANSE